MHDELADFRRTGKCNFVDFRMSSQRRTGCFAIASNDVHNAVGKTRFLDEFP